MLNKKFVIYCTAILLFLCSNMVFAQSEDNSNKLLVGLDFSFGKDSNIVETANEVDDNFITIQPELVYTRSRDNTFFYLGYSLRHDSYLDNSDFDNTSHNLDFLLKFHFAENFTFFIEDKYIDSVYGLWRAETDTVSGDGYMNNRVTPALVYESSSGSFTLDFRYNYLSENWDSIDGRDWTTNSLNAKLTFALGSFTHLGVFADYVQKDFADLPSDYTSYFAGLVVDYSMPELFDIMFRAGAENRDYSDIDETKDLTAYELQFNKLFTETTSAKFGVLYRLNDSEVYLGDYYDSFGVNLNISYLFRDKYQLFLRGEYLDNNYQFTDREDTLTRIYPGLGFQLLDWLAIQAFYNYSQRDSNMPDYDINDSRIELHLNFTKDFLF